MLQRATRRYRSPLQTAWRSHAVILQRRSRSGRAGHRADAMTDEEEQALRAKLAQLRQEHGDLDAAISAMIESSNADQLQLTRLKKRKLQLKDQIARIEDTLLPDITA
jgi:hypothetical protein